MSNILSGGFLSGKKTYISAIVGIIGALVAYAVGEADLVTTFQVVLSALSAAGLRASFGRSGFLKGYKTYLTAFSGLVGAVSLYLTGDSTLIETFQTVVVSLSAIGLRAGVTKATK